MRKTNFEAIYFPTLLSPELIKGSMAGVESDNTLPKMVIDEHTQGNGHSQDKTNDHNKDDDGLTCLSEGCKFEQKDVGTRKGPSLQCIFCMKWYHLICVGASTEHLNASFSFPSCCTLSKQIAKLQTEVSNIQATYNHQITSLEKALSKKEKALLDRDNECKRLNEENTERCVQIAKLNTKINCKAWQVHRKDKDNLLTGDSVIRDMDEKKLVNTKIHHHRGAKVNDIINDLDKLADEGPYINITLTVGTNDIADQTAYMDGILDKYKTLLYKATDMAQKVTVSSILPHKEEAMEKVGLLMQG